MSNYYQILRCRRNATYEEVKRAYHDLALKCHPDKSDGSDNGSYSFQEISEAWNVLRDPIKRRSYDENLRHRELEEMSLMYGAFTLRDLNYDHEKEIYTYPCKCGSLYIFSKKGSEEFNSCLVSCEQCSLTISIDLQ